MNHRNSWILIFKILVDIIKTKIRMETEISHARYFGLMTICRRRKNTVFMLYFDAKTDTKALTNLLLCQHVLLLPSDIVLSRSCEIASQVVVSLWNLTRGTTANLHKRRSNCRATGQLHLSQCLPNSYTMPPYDVTRDHRVKMSFKIDTTPSLLL